jgi:hypothetical protein
MRMVGASLGISIFAFAVAAVSACSIPAKGEVKVSRGDVSSDDKVLQDVHPTPIPLPRDPQIALHEEFEAAKQANTKAAWALFLRRHPDSTLVDAARREIRNLGLNTKGE